MIAQLARRMLELSFTVGLLILLFALLRPLAAKWYTARWRCAVWLLFALRLLIPWQFSLPERAAPVTVVVPDAVVWRGAANAAAPQATGGAQADAPGTAAQPGADALQAGLPGQAARPDGGAREKDAPLPTDGGVLGRLAAPVSLSQLAAALWLAGAAGLLAFSAGGYLRSRRRLLRASRSSDALTAKMNAARAAVGVRRRVPLLVCPLVEGPVLVGLASPRVLVPREDYDDETLAMCLRHELIHYRRRDVGLKLLMRLACCLYWYHPCVWLMASLAGQDAELACDEEVVRGGDRQFRAAYSDSILRVLEQQRRQPPACSAAFGARGKRRLRQRFLHIFDGGKKRAAVLLTALLLCVTLPAATLVACRGEASGGDAPAADAGLGEARPLLTAEELPPEALPESALYLAETYEAVCGGSPHPEKDPDLYNPSWIYLGYGLLRREGLVDEWLEQKKQSYPNSNYVVFTLYESAVLAQPFFVDPPPIQPLPLSENGESFGSIAEDYRMQTSRLRLERLTRTEDGCLSAEFARIAEDGGFLGRITYLFAQAGPEVQPDEILAGAFPPDKPLWQIKAVLPDGQDASPAKPTPGPTPRADPVPEDRTVEISTAQALVEMAAEVNESEYGCLGVTYLLTADIDLAEVRFEPIGLNEDPEKSYWGDEAGWSGFNGTFDGQGHTIANLTVLRWEGETPEDKNCAGLFAMIGADGEVKNLKLTNARIEGQGDSGILVGICRGKAENCSVQGSIFGRDATGGFAGYLKPGAQITDCSARAQVMGACHVGGFGGSISDSVLTGCTAEGTLTAYNSNTQMYPFSAPFRVGGFAGYLWGSRMENCHSGMRLVVQDAASYLGAFVGEAFQSSCSGCTADAAAAGNWQLIDVVDWEDGVGEKMKDYDVRLV